VEIKGRKVGKTVKEFRSLQSLTS